MADGNVAFRWRDRHRGRTKLMMLDAHEFIDLPPCSNLCIE